MRATQGGYGPLRGWPPSLAAAASLASFVAPAATAAPVIKSVHEFTANAMGHYVGGATPLGEVIEAPDGSFFTTAEQGGTTPSCIQPEYVIGCGTVVQLTGTVASVIFAFTPPATGQTNGALPAAGLVQGPDGALYGTTIAGPLPYSGLGTIFKLIPQAGGGWSIQTLHSFTGGGNDCIHDVDGATPAGRLVFAPDGFLYGVTSSGGCVIEPNSSVYFNQGTLFRIATDGSGYANLHDFNGYANPGDAAIPLVGLTAGPGGLLYGTSVNGGAADDGTVFAFNPASGTVTELHSFSGASPDGGAPMAALTVGSDGLLWGTTFTSINGADPTANGTVFNISPAAPYAITSYALPLAGPYMHPQAGLTEGSDGNYYGTASNNILFSISETGTLTNLGNLGTATGGAGMPLAAPLQAANGRIYGTLSQNGPDKHGLHGNGDIWDYSNGLHRPKAAVNWFMPSHGAAGSSVVLAGSNFVGTTKVLFAGTSATATFTVNASGFITATVPAGAVTGDVKVTTPAGTTASTVSFSVP
jgi:uncharacterized repeat protein (TIGR03803 family)